MTESRFISNRIECWLLLKNNRIVKKTIPYDKEKFEYAGKTYFLGNRYYIRKFKILFVPITKLCLFYSQDSPDPIEIYTPEGAKAVVDHHYVTTEQITERFRQGGHYVKMSMETPFDLFLQKIQTYGIVGCLVISGFMALKVFGVVK